MKPICTAAALAAIACAAAAAPLERGVARLDVGVEPQRVTMQLALPASVVGEREARSDAERAQAEAALAKLRDAAALFRIDPAAHCAQAKTTLGPEAADEVTASVEFACTDGARAGFVEVGLFDAFARLQRVDVRTVTRKGQLQAVLKRPTSRLPLAR